MASTSPEALARELLRHCIEQDDYPEPLARQLIEQAAAGVEAASALFGILVERLGDLFEPRLTDLYARLFSSAIEYVEPELNAASLLARFDDVRQVRPCTVTPSDVFILSRITLGADVVVTSTVIDAVSRRFSDANLWFVGPRKNFDLFAGHPRLERLSLDYPRGGTLSERVSVWRKLAAFFTNSPGIVVDPDSRLTQLGLLPVCPPERYFFFDSRSFGGDGDEPLALLTRRWAAAVFGVDRARPFIAPQGSPGDHDVTVSLGVGHNDEKRVADPFERRLFASFTNRSVTADLGGAPAEAERVKRAVSGLANVRMWQGDYAPFAAMIARSRLFVGYDSAGQHVAAAARTPLVSVFAGHASERMFQRWRPTGTGPIEIVKVAPGEAPEVVLDRTLAAIERMPE